MKRKIMLITAVLLVMFSVAAFAIGSREHFTHRGTSSKMIPPAANESGRSLFRSGIMYEDVVSRTSVAIYNITLVATSSNAVLDVFDVSDLSYVSPVVEYISPIAELRVATAGNTQTIDMSQSPMLTDNGLVVQVTNGSVYFNAEGQD